MMKTIRQYKGRTGTVSVVEYNEDGSTEYGVISENKSIQSYWTKDKVEAIKHAQFLSAKY